MHALMYFEMTSSLTCIVYFQESKSKDSIKVKGRKNQEKEKKTTLSVCL